MFVFNISKIGTVGKKDYVSGNTFFTEKNTFPSELKGKVQYITKQKEKKCACPGKWIFNTNKYAKSSSFSIGHN